jgi:hypothetical protein
VLSPVRLEVAAVSRKRTGHLPKNAMSAPGTLQKFNGACCRAAIRDIAGIVGRPAVPRHLAPPSSLGVNGRCPECPGAARACGETHIVKRIAAAEPASTSPPVRPGPGLFFAQPRLGSKARCATVKPLRRRDFLRLRQSDRSGIVSKASQPSGGRPGGSTTSPPKPPKRRSLVIEPPTNPPRVRRVGECHHAHWNGLGGANGFDTGF